MAIATALPTRAQLGESGLTWEQRFLGILPLVKPDPKDPVVVTVNGAPITAAEISDYANTEKHMINATSTEEMKAVFRDATENLINRQLLLQEATRRKMTSPTLKWRSVRASFRLAAPKARPLRRPAPPTRN